MMLNPFKRRAKVVAHLEQLEPCPVCKGGGYSSSAMSDLINCDNCGAVYFIGLGVECPVARVVYREAPHD